MEPQTEPVEIDAVTALLDSLDDASGHEVAVYELTPEGRQMLTRAGAAEFDVWDFAEKFGGGEYELRLRDVRTKQLGTSRRFRVSKRVPRRDAPPAQQPAAPASVYTGDRTIDLMLAMMKQSADQAARSAEQQTQLLTALINRPQPAPPDNGLKFGDVIQAATLLAGKGGTAGGIGELLDGVKKIQELAGTAPATGASDEVELAKAFAPAITALLSKPAQQTAPQQPYAGIAGAGALPPALPAPSTTTTPAQATAADTPATNNDRPAVPAPIADDERGQAATAAIDTIAAIALRLGLETGGAIDAETTAKIARQCWAALDLDTLGDMLAAVKPGELAAHVIAATPALLREQMQTHADALKRVEGYLRDTHEAAQTEDDDDDQEQTTNARDAEPVTA